jgi:spoIIIJ-associated protein
MSNETCHKANDFLTEVFTDLQFDLTVKAQQNDEGCLLNMSGSDTSLLLNEGGELLDAFETILFQIYGREIDKTERFICDAEGFRQTRKAELQVMARFAAQNVRRSGKPFIFGKLNATERRMIHLTLAGESDLQTESIGVGKDRQLQVKLK